MNLLEHLRSRLPQEPPELRGHEDYDFAGMPFAAAMKSAVLLPIVLGKPLTLLFTRRTQSLARHSGQVSFPGGRSDGADRSPIETALRETFEETGIASRSVTVAGYLARYLTATGFDIQPVVGLVARGFVLSPNRDEVAQVFEVPLSFLRDPANRRRHLRPHEGGTRSFFAFTYEQHEIWGATAAMVVDLAQRLGDISLDHAD